MTENNVDIVQNIDTQQEIAAAPEKTLTQSQVNEIVKHAKRDAVESFKRLQTEQPEYARQKYGEQAVRSPSLSEEDIRKLTADEVLKQRDSWVHESQRKLQQQEADQVVKDFYDKVTPGKQKYQDFDNVIGDVNLENFPNVVTILAKHVDNADSMLYELSKDRIKMANLEFLASKDWKGAISAASRISQSIKDNETASKARTPNDPLSRMRPTTVNTSGTDSSAMSIKDWKRFHKV